MLVRHLLCHNQMLFTSAAALGGIAALVRLLGDEAVSNFALAAALSIVTVLANFRAVKETLFFSDSFMVMLQRYMSHPDEELAAAARQTAHVLSQEAVPPAMLRLNSFL